MFEILFMIGTMKFSYNLISGPTLWISILLIAIIVGILVFIFFYKYSKNPDEWGNKTLLDEGYLGELKDFTESLKSGLYEYKYNTTLEQTLQLMFFKKVEANKGIPLDQLIDIRNRSPHQLYQIIQNDEIVNWIYTSLKFGKDRIKKPNWFTKYDPLKIEKYLNEIDYILNKMEAWGE
jgi:hypothetical protein